MRSRDSDMCLPTGTSRVDRENRSKYEFDSLRLDIKHPSTAVLLLQCEEKPILLAAAAALAKFGTKAQENLEVLFDLEIVENVIPLTEHDDLYTRRFAAKLLAQMAAIPSVKNYLLDSDRYVPFFVRVLEYEKDTFMQEFSSLILAELSKDAYGTAKFLELCPSLDFLFTGLQSADPDVQKNSIEIINNTLNDPTGAKTILNANNFSFLRIYELFNQPYPEIQGLALDVIAELLARNKDEDLQNNFRETGGLQALLNILEKVEWDDLHSDVLKLFALATENRKTADLFNEIGGIPRLFKYLDVASNPKLFLDAFNVIVRLTNTPNGRKALYSHGIVDYLLASLQSIPQYDICEISCYGIGKMTLYASAAQEITAGNPIEELLKMLKNESIKWTVRDAALFAIKELLACDVINCQKFADLQGHNYLLWLIKQAASEVSIETQMMAVEAFTTIIKHSTLRNIIINSDAVEALCTPFQSSCPSTEELKILCCRAMSSLCIDAAGREAFLRAEGVRKLYNLMTDIDSIPVRNAAVQLVQQLCTDPALADAFVRTKYLQYMLNNRSSSRIIPTWETCIEALYNSHLPIKFAFTGRLSLHDLTKDGFYVMRRNICPFPILDDVFRFKFSPLEPVYVVNYNQTSEEFVKNIGPWLFCLETRKSIGNDSISEGIFLSAKNANFDRLQPDPYLREYLELFRRKLLAVEKGQTLREKDWRGGLADMSLIALRASMLAKFVARQMSGPEVASTCVDHQLEIHLKELKDYLESSVIPLGLVRVGSYLERALLFKVIADRIGLPAALVRAEYGKAWIEIAIPQIETPSEKRFSSYLNDQTPCMDFVTRRKIDWPKEKFPTESTSAPSHLRSILPIKLLRANYIVDLMDEPGKFLPIASNQSTQYRKKSFDCHTSCKFAANK